MIIKIVIDAYTPNATTLQYFGQEDKERFERDSGLLKAWLNGEEIKEEATDDEYLSDLKRRLRTDGNPA